MIRDLGTSAERGRVICTRAFHNMYTQGSSDIPHIFDIQEFHEYMRGKYASKLEERKRTWRVIIFFVLFSIALVAMITTGLIAYLTRAR